MLCSKCSERLKPIVVLDIDGTLGDYHGHFFKFALRYLGMEDGFRFRQYNGIGSYREWFLKQTGVDPRTWYDIKLAYRQGAQKRSMPIYDGAEELCVGMREVGAELWLCTTRPFMRLDRIDPDTRFWLSRYNIQYDGLIHDDDKYQLLSERINGDRIVAILDDEIEQVQLADNIFGTAIPFLRHNGYNSLASYPQSIYDLHDARRAFISRIKTWQEASKLAEELNV